MTFASGSLVGMSYVQETTHGSIPPTPTMKTLRTTGQNINLQKGNLESAESRPDRQTADFRHGFRQVVGSLGFEFMMECYDDLLTGALADEWFSVGAVSGTFAVDVTTTPGRMRITRATGDFLTTGLRRGDYVGTSGFTDPANNLNAATTPKRISSISALWVELEYAGAVTEAAAAARNIIFRGARLDVSNDPLKTFTMERRFNGIAKYQRFRGVAINQFSLQVQPEQIATGTFDVLGMAASSPGQTTLMQDTSLGTPVAAAARSPFSSFGGELVIGNAAQLAVTGINFTLNNNRALQAVVGPDISPDVFEGRAIVEGQLTVLLESDQTLVFDRFFNETESLLQVRLADPGGTDWMSIVFPRTKFNAADIDPPDDGPIPVTVPFRALLDSVSGTTMTIQRSTPVA